MAMFIMVAGVFVLTGRFVLGADPQPNLEKNRSASRAEFQTAPWNSTYDARTDAETETSIDTLRRLQISPRRGVLSDEILEFSEASAHQNSGSSSLIGQGVAGAGGICPGPLNATHTNANFTGDSFVVQAGFSQNEIAAVSFTLGPNDFPIRIDSMECIFAQQNAIEPTETRWSVLVWDGTPLNGDIVAVFSSDDEIIPHLRMPAGTQGTNVQVIIDPSDPEPILIFNETGSNTFSIGFRIDRHNNQTQNPCLISPPSNRNAFPTTDIGGVASLTGNWLSAINCGQFGCRAGWSTFSQLGICRPSGDWVMRATYTCTPSLQIGACCHGSAVCDEAVESSACQDSGGTFMGNETMCADIICPDAVGACCLGTSCFSNVTASNCHDGAGVFLGGGSTCNGAPCNPGACCMSDGNCESLIGSACNAQGGTFRGPATICETADCPQPLGACCVGEVCFPGQLEAVCNGVGTWQGFGSTCTAGLCALPECPIASAIEILPVSLTIDARQPHLLTDKSLDGRQGIGGPNEPIRLGPFSSEPALSCFSVCESHVDPMLGANAVINLTGAGAPGIYHAWLAHPITPGGSTSLAYMNQTIGVFTSHPGNVDADNLAGPLDILRIIDYLNGAAEPPYGLYSMDIDHSGESGPADILRTIDLMNGAGMFDPWLNTARPLPTICP